MSKAFIADVLQGSAELTGAAANRAAGDLMDAIVKELKKAGKFTLPSFGTFTVRKTKARKGLNPRTGESIMVKAGKTVRFKASPTQRVDEIFSATIERSTPGRDTRPTCRAASDQ